MQEKFLALPRVTRAIITIVSWLLTVAGFVGCLLVKQNESLYWLQIILTCIGMFFAIASICLTVFCIFAKEMINDK